MNKQIKPPEALTEFMAHVEKIPGWKRIIYLHAFLGMLSMEVTLETWKECLECADEAFRDHMHKLVQ